MRFEGELAYLEEPGHLRFERFVVKDESVAFELNSVTPEYGAWEIKGSAAGDGECFVASLIYAFQGEVRSDPFSLEFLVDIAPDRRTCFVQGTWRELGSTTTFSGDLHAV